MPPPNHRQPLLLSAPGPSPRGVQRATPLLKSSGVGLAGSQKVCTQTFWLPMSGLGVSVLTRAVVGPLRYLHDILLANFTTCTGTRTFSDIKHLPHKGNNLLTPYKSYKQGKSPSGLSPRDRLLSAKIHAIRALQNELAEAKRELDEHRKENRLLNRLQVRQERELTKYQSKEGELPQILIQHAEEVRALREQLKRTQEASGGYQRKVNDLRQELQRVSERRKKLEEVVKRRHLLERETLTVQLQEANDSAEEKNRRIAVSRTG